MNTNPKFEAYKVLGVHRGNTDEEIKAAYKRLAMLHHPDRPGADAQEFQKIQTAWNCLKGVSRLRHIQELQFLGDPCGKCGGSGVRRKQKGWTDVVLSACENCGGCGYVPRIK